MNKKEINRYLFNGRSTYLNGSISAWRLQVVNPTKDGFTRKSFGWTGRKTPLVPKNHSETSWNSSIEESANEFDLEASASGTLIKNLVACEDYIREGQALILFNTLNLELIIPSPISGKVIKLNYETGDKVEKGNCLATISSNT